MGILNVTPDSFSDGGAYDSIGEACQHGLEMVAAGAEIIDIGGESTRPGSDPVDAAAEIERVIPVLKAIRQQSDVFISIDTTKAEVASLAMAHGANIINDVSGMTADPNMIEVARKTDAAVVVMHMRGTPKSMQSQNLDSENIVAEVSAYLHERVETLCAAGIPRPSIAIDPGVGFGKTVEQNLELVAGIGRLTVLGQPVLLGVSRKSVLGAVTGRPIPERGASGNAMHMYGIRAGAHLLRVHDVSAARDVLLVAEALAQAESRV
jgi:dihydropteroate synthase